MNDMQETTIVSSRGDLAMLEAEAARRGVALTTLVAEATASLMALMSRAVDCSWPPPKISRLGTVRPAHIEALRLLP